MILDQEKIAQLEKDIAYTFMNQHLVEQAFIHPSSDIPGASHYERLEFLGDEVVGLAVSTLLYGSYPEAEEGSLSKARANLIDETGLAMMGRSLNLGKMILLGKGEERQGGREKDSIISNVFEALMAVIYLEAGWNKAYEVVEKLFSPLIAASPTIEELLFHINRDYKTKLQEIAQNLTFPLPEYTLIDKRGPEHDALFIVECATMGYTTQGNGKNKKMAEQDAARKILVEMRVLPE